MTIAIRPPSRVPVGQMPGRDGVTLVELMAVVAVIGILAGIAFPAIDPTRFQVESEMLAVGGTLQSAQREAVARQHDVVVTIDPVQERLELHFDADNDGVRDPGERIRPLAIEREVVFGLANAPARGMGAQPVNLPLGPNALPRIIFRRNGSASTAGGMYLTSRKAAQVAGSRTNDTRAIEVIRATGRIEWWKYTGGTWRRGF